MATVLTLCLLLCLQVHWCLLVVQTSLRIEAHKDDVNAVCFGEDSPNIIVTGSDDHLIKVRCSAATATCTVVGAFCWAAAIVAKPNAVVDAAAAAATAACTAAGTSAALLTHMQWLLLMLLLLPQLPAKSAAVVLMPPVC